MRRGQIAIFIIGIVLSLYFWRESFRLPKSLYQTVGAEYYPRLVATLFLILAVVLLAKEVYRSVKWKGNDEQGNVVVIPREAKKLLIPAFILSIAYMIAVGSIGYYVTTFLFIALFMYVLYEFELSKIPLILAVSLGISVVIYVVFSYFFNIYIPKGLLF